LPRRSHDPAKKRAACANGAMTVDEIAQKTPFVVVNLRS
jgi:hypothetical protein